MHLFPLRKLSRSRLLRIYHKHGIKYKKVKITKILTRRLRLRVNKQIRDVKVELE